MVNVVFIGPPGCGKGTQSDLLQKKDNFVKLSTGDILRKILKKESDLSTQLKNIMNSGDLVPDKLIIDILFSEMRQYDKSQKFLFDGFPRTLEQAQELEKNTKIDKVINFDIDHDIIIDRIINRFSCQDCGEIYNYKYNKPNKEGVCNKCGSSNFLNRADDDESSVRNRLKVYNEKTKPLIEFYRRKGNLINIDANDKIETIYNKIITSLQ